MKNIQKTYETFLEATGDQRTAALLTVAAAIQENGQKNSQQIGQIEDRLADLRDEVAASLSDQDDTDRDPFRELLA